jgi:dihydroxy-acid dehydratase
MAILGELSRAGLLDTSASRVDCPALSDALKDNDIRGGHASAKAQKRALAAPGGKFNLVLGSQGSYFDSPDTDAAAGCIRSVVNAYSRDGGLAVLFGNIARRGCIVKTAGVDESILRFEGTARVFESQEQAAAGILGGKVQAGDVVVIRYEGPRGGPGMQEMLYPTSYLKRAKLDRACALLTDGRFSGGTSGLSIGHCSPEAAAGGEIALLRDGDRIVIDIPNRTIDVRLSDGELQQRRSLIEAYRPENRDRTVSRALKAYAKLVSSADEGAVRIVEQD